MSVTHTAKRTTIDASAEISAHIEEFKSRGGEIQEIPVGMSAESYRVEVSEKTGMVKWKGLNGTEHMRKKQYGSLRKGK